MSDQPLGAGWWQASDGRWYPPEQHPNAQQLPPPPPVPQTAAPRAAGSTWGVPSSPLQQAAPPQRSQGRGALLAVVLVLLLLLVGGCTVLAAVMSARDQGRAATAESVVDAIPTTTALAELPANTVPPPPSAPTETAPPATEAPAPAQASMPNVVCMNLQDAQDAIQAAGVFFSQSFDATGADRLQVLDRNWIVVSQDPAPGVLVGEGDANLGAVKIGEPNSC